MFFYIQVFRIVCGKFVSIIFYIKNGFVGLPLCRNLMHSIECPLFVVVVVYMETAALKARSLCHEVYVIIFDTKEIRHFVIKFENHSNVLCLNLISLECQSPLFCFVGVVLYMGLTKPKKGVCFISFSVLCASKRILALLAVPPFLFSRPERFKRRVSVYHTKENCSLFIVVLLSAT